MVTATGHRAIMACICFMIMIELIIHTQDISAETSLFVHVRAPGDHPNVRRHKKSRDNFTSSNKFGHIHDALPQRLWKPTKLLPIYRTAWTRRGGTVYCALTSVTPTVTICMKSIRLSETSTPTGNGASRVPWRSARVSYPSSETAKSPRRSSGWPYCTRPRRDAAISCTSSQASSRVRGARRCRISWAYLFCAAKSRPRCPPLATTPLPMRICRNCSYTTWLTLWGAGKFLPLLFHPLPRVWRWN